MAATPSNPRSRREMAELQIRLAEAEDTLNAIRSGAVDALVVHTPRGEQLFTLKGADQTYRALVEAMNEGAVTLQRGIISYCNRHFANMLRAPLEKVLGARITDLVRSEKFAHLLGRLRTGRAIRGSAEALLLARAGGPIPVQVSASRFHAGDNLSICLVVTDISDRKKAERARRELSRSILNAQEKERQRVARDLHDGVNQLLSSARYRLSSITAHPSAEAEKVLAARELIEKAIHEVRLISRNLRPSELDDLGLAAALRGLAHDFRRRTGTTVRFRSKPALLAGVPKEVEMTLYRIAQETLNNVEKHAGARLVDISLTGTSSELVLNVRDNGRGVADRTANGVHGWGLQNMTERASLLGGVFQITSAPGKGTVASARVPLRAPAHLRKEL